MEIAGTCVAGSNTRSGLKATQNDAPTNTKRKIRMRPEPVSNAPNQLNGLRALAKPSPDCRIAEITTTKYIVMIASNHVTRKKRRHTPYSMPSGQANTTIIRPPKIAATSRYSKIRNKPNMPPTRGPPPVDTGTISPMTAGSSVPTTGTVSPGARVDSEVAVEVNENEPILLSGNAQLTVHSPAGGICVSAAETVNPSAPSCGCARPTSVPSQASERPMVLATSGLASASRKTICNCVGGTSTTWLAAGFDDTTSLVPAAPEAPAEEAAKPSPKISPSATPMRRTSGIRFVIGLPRR